MKKSLNKKELAELLAEEFDITKKAALEEVQFLLDEITAQLVKGNSVDLSGFGKFSVKESITHYISCGAGILKKYNYEKHKEI